MHICGAPIWRPKNTVNIWNLVWSSRTLIIYTGQTNIYINTFPTTLTSQMAKKSQDKCIFFDKHDRNCMSRTAITLKFKVRWFPSEGRYWAEKLQTGIILIPLIPDVDVNFGVSLVLDFST